jgi:hypothetical protein
LTGTRVIVSHVREGDADADRKVYPKRRSLYALMHIVSASLGGALAGLMLGGIGLLLPTILRLAVATAVAALAAYLAIRPQGRGRGVRRQVPRGLGDRLHPLLTYAAWGAELGSGLSTLIPYSAFLLLIAFELLSGPLLGAIAGAAFGAARQGAAVLAARRRGSPGEIMGLLPRLALRARRANLIVCLTGSAALVFELVR